AGLCRRLPAGGPVLPARLPALGLAAVVLHRGSAGAARAVRAGTGAGVRRVARNAPRELERPGPRDRVELEAVSLSHRPDGDDEHGVARHPGHVSHVPRAGLGLPAHAVRGFLPGFAYQCGVAIASQIPHVQALFATRTSYAQAMALSAAIVFVLGAVVAGLGPERRGVAFGRGPS